SGGRARWGGGASGVAGLEDDVDLYRGVSARVEDLSPLDAHDRGCAHRPSASAPFGSSWASPISSTTWSKSSPSSSPPSCWPIVLAQRAMLFGSFSSTSERPALSLSWSSRLSSESTWAVREINRGRRRPTQIGHGGEDSYDATLRQEY